MLAAGNRVSHHLRECDCHFGFGLGSGFTSSAVVPFPPVWPRKPTSLPLISQNIPHRSQRRGSSFFCSIAPSTSPGEIPVLSDSFSPREDDREVSVAGGIVALGKFDALHVGHRELAIQASKVGPPFLLSFAGIAEVLGWEPRAPVVAQCDRKRVLSSWAPYCGNSAPSEYRVEFSSVRHLTPREFVEKLSKELGVRGVVAGITDSGMAAIGSGLSNLQTLDVAYCRKLTDKGLSAVAEGCHDLRNLNVAGCKLVTDGLLRTLSNNCPNLEELGLHGCTNITDSGLTELVKGCQKIKLLDINKCSNVGDIGVSSVSKACSSSLKTLKLLDCYKIKDASIISIAQFCTNLETLIIGGCRDISDESIQKLADACKSNLRTLRMDWCLNVSDSSLSCIFTHCRNLEALDIGCCEEVTDAAFHTLGNQGTQVNLKVLKVSNCPKITLAALSILLDKCNSLEYLDVRSCPHITKAGCDEAGLQFPESCKVNFTGSLCEPDLFL